MNPAALVVDRESAVPLQQQLVAAFRDAILSGRIVAGERVLSSRELCTHLGVSRNTVVNALERLHAEGYLVTVRGVGTFVAESAYRRVPVRPRRARTALAPSRFAACAVQVESLVENLDAALPFRPGVPALDRFPVAAFKRCFDLNALADRDFDYPETLGYGPLRRAIAARLAQSRGIVVDSEDVLITGGAQSALAAIAQVLLNSGDRAVIEDPAYPNATAILRVRSAAMMAVPVDEEGISVERFARSAARLAYVTPSHQYPMGWVLSLERRLKLLAWAERCGAWIVEDDYDSEFDYTGRRPPALHALAAGGRVLYVGTFSKTLAPALRIGYIIVPPELRRALLAAHAILGGAPGLFVQAALARFIERGYLGRHIARMRRLYDERREAAARALWEHCGHGVRVMDAGAGLHFVALLRKGIDDRAASRLAAQAGIIVPALSAYAIERTGMHGLVVGFAATPPLRAWRAAQRLAQVL
jgi:GntR family transcriptional regulator / MocR family aminotransferase